MDAIHARTSIGANIAQPRSERQIMFAPLAAALFLVGGVATYVAPPWNPPLYIAGSAVMLIGALIGIWIGRVRALLRRWNPIGILKLAVVASILTGSFCCGFLL